MIKRKEIADRENGQSKFPDLYKLVKQLSLLTYSINEKS